MEIRLDTQGWRQFQNNRKSILAAFDEAKTQDSDHETQTYRGRVAEAQFRSWLTAFLPARYGVSAGYIISQGLPSTVKHKQFDVIIYDRLNAPTLWIENNKDASDQGRNRAIPVEHVLSVIEVKAALTRKSAKKATAKLSQLAHLLGDVDKADARYKFYLPPSFFYGAVFFELREEDSGHNCPEHLFPVTASRGHIGSIVLRAGDGDGSVEQLNPDASARMLLLKGHDPVGARDVDRSMYKNGIKHVCRHDNDVGDSIFIHWGINNFSMFAFDILRMLDGSYDPGKISSLYGLGKNPDASEKAV